MHWLNITAHIGRHTVTFILAVTNLALVTELLGHACLDTLRAYGPTIGQCDDRGKALGPFQINR